MARRMDRLKEKFWLKLAWALPKKLVYWCFVRVVTYATVGEYSGQVMGELTIYQVMNRWPK